ncbi:hypothetical protein HDE_02663 [Halotydeus destructor]|nr:hypothetical protein HDE_02663 [Halotydeus destructor]
MDTIDARISILLEKVASVKGNNVKQEDLSSVQNVLELILTEIVQKDLLHDCIFQVLHLATQIRTKYGFRCGFAEQDGGSISSGSFHFSKPSLLTEQNVSFNSTWDVIVQAIKQTVLIHLSQNLANTAKEKFMIKKALYLCGRLWLEHSDIEVNSMWNFYNEIRSTVIEKKFNGDMEIKFLEKLIEDFLGFEASLIKEGVFGPLDIDAETLFFPYVAIMRNRVASEFGKSIQDTERTSYIVLCCIECESFLSTVTVDLKLDGAQKRWLVNKKFLSKQVVQQLLRHANNKLIELANCDSGYNRGTRVLEPICYLFEQLRLCHIARIKEFTESLQLTLKLNLTEYLNRFKQNLVSTRSVSMEKNFVLLNTCYFIRKKVSDFNIEFESLTELINDLKDEITQMSLVIGNQNCHLIYFRLYLQKFRISLSCKLSEASLGERCLLYCHVYDDSLSSLARKELSAEDIVHVLTEATEFFQSIYYKKLLELNEQQRIASIRRSIKQLMSNLETNDDRPEILAELESLVRGSTGSKPFSVLEELLRDSSKLLLEYFGQCSNNELTDMFGALLDLLAVTESTYFLTVILLELILHDEDSKWITIQQVDSNKSWWQLTIEHRIESTVRKYLEDIAIEFGYSDFICQSVFDNQFLSDCFDELQLSYERSRNLAESRTALIDCVYFTVLSMDSSLFNSLTNLESQMNSDQLYFGSLAAHVTVNAVKLFFAKSDLAETESLNSLLGFDDHLEYAHYCQKFSDAKASRHFKANQALRESDHINLLLQAQKLDDAIPSAVRIEKLCDESLFLKERMKSYAEDRGVFKPIETDTFYRIKL